MLRTLLPIAAISVLLVVAPALADEQGYFEWVDLVDEAAQVYEDPYRDISPDQLDTLVSLVRLQEQLQGGSLDEAVRPRVEARIAQKQAELADAGVDIEWLVEQRWVVAEKRRQAALAVNPDFDGSDVRIGGFLIPAPPTEDGQPTAYLVPQRGMCAHVPPPPPNQLLQLVLSDASAVERIYEPVIVHGTLLAKETQREVFVVDGPVAMWSAWTVEGATLDLIMQR